MDLEAAFSDLERRDWETEDPTGTLRLAIIGLGGFAREYAIPGIARGDYCTTTVMVSGSAEKAERWTGEFDADQGIMYDEFHEGAATEAYDAVYIVTPNATHLDFARTAAEHGKHVICEKPLEATAERAAALVEACERAGVRLMTAYRLQTEPILRRMREAVASGTIGDLVSFHGEFAVRSLRGDRTPDHWRYDADLAGGGAMMDIGVYPLNTGRFLLGLDPVDVAGTTASPNPVFADVDERVVFELGLPGDVSGLCSATYDGQPGSGLTIQGIEGRIRIDTPFEPLGTREVTIDRGDASVSATSPPVDELTEQFDYFAYAVLTDSRIEPDGADGLLDVHVAEAVYESARTGHRISL